MKEKKVAMYSDLNEVDQLKIRGLCILVIAMAIMMALKFVMVGGFLNSLFFFSLTILILVFGGIGVNSYIKELAKREAGE